jgi:hypothetical protein
MTHFRLAWFMAHRIRESMRPAALTPMGGGKVVEIDETYISRIEGAAKPKHGGLRHKTWS